MAALSKPASLVSRHKRYKAGTKQVIQWLARTASRVSDLTSCLDCLKPKADGNIAFSPKELETLRIKTRELVKLAEVIASSDPPVDVPSGLLQVLDDVISGRQACAAWYAAQAIDNATNLAAQNDAHAHFIQILTQVRALLQPAVKGGEVLPSRLPEHPAKKPSKKNKGKRTPVVDGMSNLFEHLALEEVLPPTLDEEPPPKYEETPAGNAFTSTTFELENSDESDAFALWCHLQDLNDIRHAVKATWAEYANGDISLEVAGMTTETAFGMMKRADEEFVAAKPKFMDWWCMAMFLRLKLAFNNNVVYTYSKDPNAVVKDMHSQVNQADLVCSAAALLLRVVREAYQQNLNGKMKQMSFEQPVGNLRGSRPTTELESTLFSFVPEITVLGLAKRMQEKGEDVKMRHYHSYFTDELTTLLPMNSEPREAAIWLVVACQMCMDIQDTVDAGCGKAALLRTTGGITSIVEACLAFHRDTLKGGLEPVRKQHLEAARGISGHLERVVKSTDLTAVDKAFFPGLKGLPHLAGEVNYFMKVRLHGIATLMANDGSAILIMAHLWKAASKYGLVTGPWHDLDFLLAHHSKNKPLFTKTNANADAYAMLRHFLLDMGVEPSALARGIVPPSPLDKVRSDRAKRVTIDDAQLTSGLRDLYANHEETKCEKGAMIDALLASVGEIMQPGKSTQKHITATDLLQVLKEQLVTDEPRLNFDYIGFSNLCKSMLGDLVAHARRTVPKKDVKELRTWPTAAYYLLRTAADAEAKSKDGVAGTTLAACADLLQTAVQSNAGVYSQAAFNQSSGRIPKDQRPIVASPGIPEPYIKEFMQFLPGASISTSRKTIEIYDPKGSIEQLDRIFNSRSMAPFTRLIMPSGVSKDIKIVVPESEVDMQELADGYSRPMLNMNTPMYGPSDEYISKEEGIEQERRMRERAGLPKRR